MDTKRRTKIVATMGPATDDPQVVAGMVGAGLDVARINFSHGTRESQRRRVEMVRQAAREAGRYIGLLADLAGPKIRIESFHHGKSTTGRGRAIRARYRARSRRPAMRPKSVSPTRI